MEQILGPKGHLSKYQRSEKTYGLYSLTFNTIKWEFNTPAPKIAQNAFVYLETKNGSKSFISHDRN